MKKIFFALAALVLAFTGCSQEEDAIQVSEKKAVKVVVNMDKPGFGEDTRTPRTDWEDGDQVIGTIGSPGIGILLTYDADTDSWTTELLKISNLTNKYVAAVAADFDEMLVNGTVNVKAAYFSSKIIEGELAFEVSPTTSLPTMVITTNASSAGLGECVMTCENGTCKVEKTASEYVLTLGITMIPQVAQFTIRDLNVEDGWNVYAYGPFNRYAGGTITPTGVELTPLSWGGEVYCYDNENGISFYVAPWQSSADMPDDYDGEYSLGYLFNVCDDGNTVDTERTFPFTQVAIGGAVIFDGPTTDGAASKWGEPA